MDGGDKRASQMFGVFQTRGRALYTLNPFIIVPEGEKKEYWNMDKLVAKLKQLGCDQISKDDVREIIKENNPELGIHKYFERLNKLPKDKLDERIRKLLIGISTIKRYENKIKQLEERNKRGYTRLWPLALGGLLVGFGAAWLESVQEGMGLEGNETMHH